MKPVHQKLCCALGEPNVLLYLQEAWLGAGTTVVKNEIKSYKLQFSCTCCVLLTACLTKYKIQNKSQRSKTDWA